ncbi:MAG: TolC family protein [Candidatus Krumholzibacteria bacterium]|jgi:outer membrane protein TolC|nr:TolC family protein [Candidatus Krumholzibacteria bacterium]MDP6669502.1 TolC family protein [Candidatus Krumholzibacteria bacterium]MDP6798160.1 TolC family protein [Candidatus Krumholzibacteria bacterium]MDP7021993.1 TolC family protein [Candidatus Krumholzibacteria bacterium]
MIKVTSLSSLLLVLALPLWAAPGDGSVSLQVYLNEASGRNPGLEASRLRWEASREQSAIVGALPDPVIRFGIFASSVETRLGPQRQKLGLSQKIPGFGKRSLMREASEALALAMQEQYRSDLLDLQFRVRRHYLEQAFLASATAIARDNLTLLKELHAVSENRYRTGKLSRGDLLLLELDIARETTRVEDLQDSRQAEVDHLYALLGDSDLLDRVPDTLIEDHPLPSYSEEIGNHNPRLRKLAMEARYAGVKSELAHRSGLPDFQLSLDYIRLDALEGSSDPENGRDPMAIGLAMNLPIARGKIRAEKAAARKQEASSEKRLRDEEARTLALIEDTRAAWREANRSWKLHQESLVPVAEEVLQLEEQAFRTGSVSFRDYLQDRARLLNLRLELERSRKARALQGAILMKLYGMEKEG